MIIKEANNIAETTSGKIKGYRRKGVIKFKGIHYASPSIGNLRFKLPTPIEHSDSNKVYKFRR